jgi:hypothetical protein
MVKPGYVGEKVPVERFTKFESIGLWAGGAV